MTPPLLYVGQKFATFKDLERQLELYQNQELMLWSVAIIKAGRTDTFPKSIGYTSMKYECVHGNDVRTGKGNKICPKQSTIKLN
ncbi:Quinolinate synthase A [Frankliniella fusca]|uniref:Quinolinate synthase A n=1 Tax=Frankliniella fusca TaxID=407009 RepID=A0AAE1LHE5_9NEOP|nr:Quinolinate synthase A [Frankliniella fusca]